MGEVIALIYFIGCFLALFPITWVTATDFGREEPDAESIMFGFAMAICGCWFWPVGVFPGIPVYYAVKHW